MILHPRFNLVGLWICLVSMLFQRDQILVLADVLTVCRSGGDLAEASIELLLCQFSHVFSFLVIVVWLFIISPSWFRSRMRMGAMVRPLMVVSKLTHGSETVAEATMRKVLTVLLKNKASKKSSLQ